MDTATQSIFMSHADATAIHEKIPGARDIGDSAFAVPCLCTTRLEFKFKDKFTLQDTTFAIDPKDLVHVPLDPNNPNGDCLSAIHGTDTNSTDMLVRFW
jgi:hypothetical protein